MTLEEVHAAIVAAHAAKEPGKITAKRIGVTVKRVFQVRYQLGLGTNIGRKRGKPNHDDDDKAARCPNCHLRLPHDNCLAGDARKGLGSWGPSGFDGY